jgi:hypothetical protein
MLLVLGVIIPLGRMLTANMQEQIKKSNQTLNSGSNVSVKNAARNIGAFVIVISVAGFSQVPLFMLSVFAPHLAFFQAYYFPGAIMPVGAIVQLSYLQLCVLDPKKIDPSKKRVASKGSSLTPSDAKVAGEK